MKIQLETKRLHIRNLTEQDVDGMFALDSDAEVHKYLGNKPITKKEEALKYIKDVNLQYKERGIGRWAVELKETGEFIGWCGLRLYTEYTFNNHTNFYDIGYRLQQKFWGKGYATEASVACLQYAWNTRTHTHTQHPLPSTHRWRWTTTRLTRSSDSQSRSSFDSE